MNIDEIKKISLVEFLNQLGYQPTGRDSKGLWFYAPYRSERNRRSMSILTARFGLTSNGRGRRHLLACRRNVR